MFRLHTIDAKMINSLKLRHSMLCSLMSVFFWLQACGGGGDDVVAHATASPSSTAVSASTDSTSTSSLNVGDGIAKASAAPSAAPWRVKFDAGQAVDAVEPPPSVSTAAETELDAKSCREGKEAAASAASGNGAKTKVGAAASATCLAVLASLAPVPAMGQQIAPTATYNLPGGAVVQLAGHAAAAGPAAVWPTRPLGRIYYVNSALGNDSATGLAETALRADGPWRSLARVGSARLNAGDMVILACGSQWNETLRLPASGTVARPIVVTAASGCQIPPAIDGSVAIAPSAWQRVSATVFRTTLNRVPDQLFATSGTFLEAHHPNSTNTSSNEWTGWAKLPSNGNVVTTKDGTGSQRVTLGPELNLPAGGVLQAGMQAHFRSHSWTIDEADVASASGTTLVFAAPTGYPLESTIGYYLSGLAWMVDSPGEWHYDRNTAQLTAWMPDSFAPSTPVYAATLAAGVDLSARQYVTINGLTVRRAGTGVVMRDSLGVEIKNNRIEDITHRGIDAANSRNARFLANTIARTGLDAIAGFVPGNPVAIAMTVQDNMITESGVLMKGDRVIGPPRRSLAAVHGVPNSIITGNTVINSGYIGIRLMGSSRVENNVVLRSCLVLDDCGGIYIWNDRDSQILNNVVAGGRGPIAGKHEREPFSAAQGVYLDEAATNIVVKGNMTYDNDHGVLLHVSSNNQIFDNTLYANRRSQMWLQASRARFIATGDMANNHIRNNFFGAFGDAGALTLDNEFGPTSGLARIEGNLAAPTHANPVRLISNVNRQTLNWREWSAQFNLPTDPGQPPSGGAESMSTWYTIAGSNLVPNAGYANAAAGWGTWNATTPFATMTDIACAKGRCLRVTAGASSTLITSPNFSVRKDQWLRLSVDIFKADNEPLTLTLRRGGGGSNGYERLTAEVLTLNAPSGWSRHRFMVQATDTVNFRDPRTGDMGARLDVEGIAARREVIVGGFEAVPIQTSVEASASALLVNAGGSSQVMACPLPAAQQAACAGMRRVADRSVVSWPIQMAPRSSLLLFGQDPALTDSDGDGIADRQDSCPGTARLAAVNARGCAYMQ